MRMKKEDEQYQTINVLLGSCPECGKGIWSNDEIMEARTVIDHPLYKCIQCGKVLAPDDLIPF